MLNAFTLTQAYATMRRFPSDPETESPEIALILLGVIVLASVLNWIYRDKTEYSWCPECGKYVTWLCISCDACIECCGCDRDRDRWKDAA